MLRRTFLGGLVVAAAVPMLMTSEAQAASWRFLGKRRVQPYLDYDEIPVGASQGTFTKIRLKVTGNDLMIYDLDVRYGNGVNDDIPVRLVIPQGGQTRAIDLRANRRFIRNVRFKYGKPVNGRGATWVELYGYR
jgi:hypothetical protein